MSRTLPYTIVDVFAEHPLEGNPLAVFHDASSLSDSEMQALARETNLSETAFILPDDPEVERRHGVRVRLFTTVGAALRRPSNPWAQPAGPWAQPAGCTSIIPSRAARSRSPCG